MTDEADSFRRIAMLLVGNRTGERPRTVILASPKPRQGTSTVAAGLAMVIGAEFGTKTLLIDAHSRRPVLHELFGVKRAPGLSDVLTGAIGVDGAVQETRQAGLFLLTAGGPGPPPAPHLHGDLTREYLKIVGEEYDMVLADGPPILTSPESFAIAPCYEGLILVVGSGMARMEEVNLARELLESAGVRVLGAILNRIRPG